VRRCDESPLSLGIDWGRNAGSDLEERGGETEGEAKGEIVNQTPENGEKVSAAKVGAK